MRIAEISQEMESAERRFASFVSATTPEQREAIDFAETIYKFASLAASYEGDTIVAHSPSQICTACGAWAEQYRAAFNAFVNRYNLTEDGGVDKLQRISDFLKTVNWTPMPSCFRSFSDCHAYMKRKREDVLAFRRSLKSAEK